MCSRRKIQLNVRVTEVVPAPEEPVTAIMGCFADMVASREVCLGLNEQGALFEQGRGVDPVESLIVFVVILFDTLDLRLAAENERNALMQLRGLQIQNSSPAGRCRAAGLLH